MSLAKEVDDETLLADPVDEVKENKTYTGDVDIPQAWWWRSLRRRTEPYKGTNLEINLHPHQGQAQLLVLVEKLNQLIIPRRVVVAGELLEDGDMDMAFPDRPPDLSPDELAEVENLAAETEINRLIDMGVLRAPRADEDLPSTPTLTTRLVCDWRIRDGAWQRRARLVARDFNWLDPNGSDTFAPTGTQSTMRLVPALSQLKQWKMMAAYVKDA